MTPARSNRSRIGNGLALLLLAMLAWWLLGLQSQPWPALNPLPTPRWWAALAIALFLALCGWAAWRGSSPRAPRMLANSLANNHAGNAEATWRVIHASQTGFALELAQRTAQALRDAGHDAVLDDIATLDAHDLRGRQCLLVASTTGEGDPPDPALGFVARTLADTADLHGTRYAVLALGDRSYAQYCAFGRQLDAWLRQAGATPLFDMIEVDNADPQALRQWQQRLATLAGDPGMPQWTRPASQPWTLRRRELLNPGSAGGPAYLLTLAPPADTVPTWQAGDIAEIEPRHADQRVQAFLAQQARAGATLDGAETVEFDGCSCTLATALAGAQWPAGDALRATDAAALARSLAPLPHRDYSIASLPADGSLQLLVRLMTRPDGSHGLGSGWLCMDAPIGTGIDLRIRSNPNFHAPTAATPMILIGNGTGLAGLRAHLKARIAAGATRNWLLFGERSAAHDRFFGDELDAWLQAGQLARLDRVYSRDGHALRYVQDALRAHADALREWIDHGAAVYVCGSLEGMAPAVDAVLTDSLGRAALDALMQSGRYRRDVY